MHGTGIEITEKMLPGLILLLLLC